MSKRFGMTYRVSSAGPDAPGDQPQGSVTMSVNIDAALGSKLTASELATQVRQALSVLLKTSLIEDLSTGTAL
jgi:hypothetical protein